MKALIAYGFHNSGHVFASGALKEKLESKGVECTIDTPWSMSSEALKYSMELFREIQRKSVPIFPAFFNDRAYIDMLCKETKLTFDPNEFDLILSTHSYSTLKLADALTGNNKTTLVDVFIDYTPFPIFTHPRVDIHTGTFVSSRIDVDTYKKVRTTGIPSRQVPAPRGDGILVMGGADGFGAIDQMYESLSATSLLSRCTFVCGFHSWC